MLKKILAGVATIALSATMAISACAESVIEITNPKTEAWKNCFDSYENEDGDSSDDYLDARTFTKDKDLKITVEFEWNLQKNAGYDPKKPKSDSNKEYMEDYCLIGPGQDKLEWLKFGDPKLDKIETDFPQANHLEAGYSIDGDAVVKDGKTEPIFVKKDGFIQINDQSITSFSFTIPKDCVNSMIENANKEDTEDDPAYDGIVFQIKNMKVKKVTTDQDGVMLCSQYLAKKASEKDSESKSDKSESSSSAASSTTESAVTEESKSGLSTGAIIAIVAGAVVVIVIVVVVVKKKK